jgi:polyhydroxybutyrate depolymerase
MRKAAASLPRSLRVLVLVAAAAGLACGTKSPGTSLGTGGAPFSVAGGADGGADIADPGAGGAKGTGGTGNLTATGGNSGGNSGAPAALPSAGCGKAPPASGRATIDVSGTRREYILKVPDGYDPSHPYRLVFGFHGAKYDDNWVADGGAPLTGPFFGLEREAKGSAIFVAPQASGGFSSQDLPFVDAMIAQFEAQLCIDKNRVFSVGFSMGAIMTITLACNRSDVFRAVAPMSGQLPDPCPTGNPIAYWASHGTNDTTIAPAKGQAARDEFAKRNHCGTQISAPDENNCVTFQPCDPGYPVVWCTFSGQHEPAPFAGPAIWKFLSPL